MDTLLSIFRRAGSFGVWCQSWYIIALITASCHICRLTQIIGAFQVQSIYPLLQDILRKRGLHFIVAPYNASAQVGYFISLFG